MLARPSFEINTRHVADGQLLLQSTMCSSVHATFFDPQYRGLNTKMQYGDVKSPTAKMAKVHRLEAMPDWMIKNMIIDIERVLVPWGHLFLWVDKYMLVSGVGMYFGLTNLQPVDMITWHKKRVGMGYRSRRVSEYLVVLQKPKNGETRARNVWKDHGIPDVWCETATRGGHPHTKPMGLCQRLIECVTEPGDLILDPACGSGTVPQAARLTSRNFLACDLVDSSLYLPTSD